MKKARYEGCLCPRCYGTKNMTDAYRGLLVEAGRATNECTCAFCLDHKKKARAFDLNPDKDAFETISYPPETSRRLAEALLCPKAALRPGSGFTGKTYPTYDPQCFRQFLQEKQLKFLDGEGTGANLGQKSRHAEVGAFARQNECRLGCCPPLHAPSDRERECCVGRSEGVSCHAGSAAAKASLCRLSTARTRSRRSSESLAGRPVHSRPQGGLLRGWFVIHDARKPRFGGLSVTRRLREVFV